MKFRSLDDSYSEKEELIAAAYYEWANNSEGISAIQRYELAGDYKDANDLKHEQMYQMIQEWGDKALTDEINDLHHSRTPLL